MANFSLFSFDPLLDRPKTPQTLFSSPVALFNALFLGWDPVNDLLILHGLFDKVTMHLLIHSLHQIRLYFFPVLIPRDPLPHTISILRLENEVSVEVDNEFVRHC